MLRAFLRSKIHRATVTHVDIDYEGSLSNGGEELTLSDSSMRTVLSADYGDEGFWPRSPDGLGYSLVLLDPAGDLDDPSNWRASASIRSAKPLTP